MATYDIGYDTLSPVTFSENTASVPSTTGSGTISVSAHWTLRIRVPRSFAVSGSSFIVPRPTIQATWTTTNAQAGKNGAWIELPLNLAKKTLVDSAAVYVYSTPIMYEAGTCYQTATSSNWISSGTRTLTTSDTRDSEIPINTIFGSVNKDSAYVDVLLRWDIHQKSNSAWTNKDGYQFNHRYGYGTTYKVSSGDVSARTYVYFWDKTDGNVQSLSPTRYNGYTRIFLDAPPSGSAYPSQSSYDYGSTVSISASGSAQYGGDVTSIEVTVGGETRTISGSSGSVSFSGLNSGTYYPSITITDSRGQTTTTTGSSFTVKAAPGPAFTPSGPSMTAFDLGDTYSADTGTIVCYGGASVSSVTLKVGSQTATRSSSGSLSLTLNAVGQFTPTIMVTDSNGRSTAKNLSTITVKNTNIFVSDLSVHRIEATGAWSDSGESCYVEAKFTVQNSTFQSPIVKVDDVTTSTSWYTAYDRTTGFSNAVSNWATVTSGTTLYGKVGATGAFSKNSSYTIGVTPRSAADTGGELRVFLPKEFFLIAGKAGGRGLGIGQKPNADELQVAMISRFYNDIYVPYETGAIVQLLDFIYPVGSYYETSNANFNPNTYWGGTWTQDTIGKVLVGKGTGYTSDGGSNSQTVPIPYHNHTGNSLSVSTNGTISVSGTGSFSGTTGTDGSHYHQLGRNVDVLKSSTDRDQLVGTSGGTARSNTSTDGSHSHSFSGSVTVNSSGSNSMSGTATGATSFAGNQGATMSVMQAYTVVYRWHRTA